LEAGLVFVLDACVEAIDAVVGEPKLLLQLPYLVRSG
jgi:hypothetical protein